MKSRTHTSEPRTAKTAKRRMRAAPAAAAAAGERAAPSPEQRRSMIAQAAYFRAEQRGFASGAELQDWLAAEAEIDRALGGPTLLEHQLAHSDT
ncbi:DUF2934 domain-containing protein [Betaproteobacteria bacterium PRO7]|nr:DUF2934 domain-containing protein [Betaproteobacteria bacterium PRO7]